jgi:hypothetical protein
MAYLYVLARLAVLSLMVNPALRHSRLSPEDMDERA